MAPRIDREAREAYPSFRKALEKLDNTSRRDGFSQDPTSDYRSDTIVLRDPNTDDLSLDESRLQAAYDLLAENESVLRLAQATLIKKRKELSRLKLASAAAGGTAYAKRKLRDEINDLGRSVDRVGETVMLVIEQISLLEDSIRIFKEEQESYGRLMRIRKEEEDKKKEARRSLYYGDKRPSLIVKLKVRIPADFFKALDGNVGGVYVDSTSDVEMLADEDEKEGFDKACNSNGGDMLPQQTRCVDNYGSYDGSHGPEYNGESDAEKLGLGSPELHVDFSMKLKKTTFGF